MLNKKITMNKKAIRKRLFMDCSKDPANRGQCCPVGITKL